MLRMTVSCGQMSNITRLRGRLTKQETEGTWAERKNLGRLNALITTTKRLYLLPLPPNVDEGYVFTHVCPSVCLPVSRISQKVVDRFRLNLVGRLGASQGGTDRILVKIWIQIRI